MAGAMAARSLTQELGAASSDTLPLLDDGSFRLQRRQLSRLDCVKCSECQRQRHAQANAAATFLVPDPGVQFATE